MYHHLTFFFMERHFQNRNERSQHIITESSCSDPGVLYFHVKEIWVDSSCKSHEMCLLSISAYENNESVYYGKGDTGNKGSSILVVLALWVVLSYW